MKLRRVKITGIGPVTPAGIGRKAFWRGILEPVSRVRAFTKLGDEYGEYVAAWIDDTHLNPHVRRFALPHHTARHCVLGLGAAALAIEDAKLDLAAVRKMVSVIVTGTSLMDFGGIIRGIDSVSRKGPRATFARGVMSVGVSQIPTTISDVLELPSRNLAIQSSCCSGLDAIGKAAEVVARGEADIAICGGTEAPLYRHPMLEFRALGMTPATNDRAHQQGRPFDLWRTTGVIGEGACMFILEPEESPRPGYGWVSGYSHGTDAVDDLCGGLEQAIRLALGNARLRPAQIDAINACAPGHPLVDAAECRVLGNVFEKRLSEIMTFSIKGAIAHALGAAPAIQAGVAALSLHHGVVPPTVNFLHADPKCSLNLSNQSRFVPHSRQIVNSHGTSGTNSCLVLERCF